MPSFSSSSVVRTADPSLLLEVTHFLVQNSPSETVHIVRGNIPENVNVILASDLVITLSGTLDRMKIRSTDIAISAVALHFKQYLETNAGQLGLNTISNIYIDETDGLPKLTLTSARTVPQGTRPPHATLVSMDIVYKWRSRPRNKSIVEEIDQLDHTNPFLSQLFLPFQTTLNTVIEKFVSVHLVKRYPFIFGPWCNKLNAETPFFVPIAHSISNILERSPNDILVQQGRRLMRTLRRQHRCAFRTSSTSLSLYLQPSGWSRDTQADDDPQESHMTDEATLCIAMERLFQHGVPRSRFRGSASVRLAAADTDATDEFDFSQSSASAADSSQAQDTVLIWDDLPLSPEPIFSPIIPIQHGYGSTLLENHNVDEYFLDDEGEWMRDGSGDWIWRASKPMMHFDFNTEDAHEQSIGSDMEEFPSDSSEGPLTPSSQWLSSPNMIDRHRRQSSAETVGPDQDSKCEAKSQDCGAEFITPNTPDYTPLLYQLDNTSSNPIMQENPIARHQREPAYLDYPINYHKDPYSDLDSNSDILDDCDEDVPEILSGSPFPDEILSGDDQFVNETFTAGTVPYPPSNTDMEGLIVDWGDEEETGLLDLDI